MFKVNDTRSGWQSSQRLYDTYGGTYAGIGYRRIEGSEEPKETQAEASARRQQSEAEEHSELRMYPRGFRS